MVNVDEVGESEHMVLVDKDRYESGQEINLTQAGEARILPVDSEEYDEVSGNETYEGRHVEEKEDHLILTAPESSRYDFSVPSSVGAEEMLDTAHNDFGSALQDARDVVDDSEVIDRLDAYQQAVDEFAEEASSRIEEAENQRDEVARQGAKYLTMAADAIRKYSNDYGNFQDDVEDRVARLHDEVPNLREPEIWDEVVSSEVQRGVDEEMAELMGEDYSPGLGTHEFDLEGNAGQDEASDSDESSGWFSGLF
jgi:hypothetical protein